MSNHLASFRYKTFRHIISLSGYIYYGLCVGEAMDYGSEIPANQVGKFKLQSSMRYKEV
jgi:hypothetical protein